MYLSPMLVCMSMKVHMRFVHEFLRDEYTYMCVCARARVDQY